MLALLFAAPLVLLASFASWRSRVLLEYYRQRAERIPVEGARRLENDEKVWRTFAHVLWFAFPFPFALVLLPQITELTELLAGLIGGAVLAGVTFTAFRMVFRIEPTRLLSRPVTFLVELGLATWGVFVSLLLAAIWALSTQPHLREELLKKLSS